MWSWKRAEAGHKTGQRPWRGAEHNKMLPRTCPLAGQANIQWAADTLFNSYFKYVCAILKCALLGHAKVSKKENGAQRRFGR